MTVKELKEKLEQFDENMKVLTYRDEHLWSFTGIHTGEYYLYDDMDEKEVKKFDNVLCIDFDY